MATAWQRAQGVWLGLLELRSRHTARSYARAVADFDDFLRCYYDVPLWRAMPAHVRAWQEHMKREGKSPSTVAQRLAAAGSFYNYILEAQRQTGEGTGLYVDAKGKWRSNPFCTAELDRPKQRKFERSRAVSAAKVDLMLRRINTATPTGARDYALLVTLLETGWQASELLRLRRGDIQQNADRPGEYLCRLGGPHAAEPAALPATCYQAIWRYLENANRSPDRLEPAEYLWRPLRTRGCKNLLHVQELEANRPITSAQALNILRKRLRAAGVTDYRVYTLQSLRSTFAKNYARTSNGDVAGLSQRLHHSMVATTQAYLKALESAPEDQPAAVVKESRAKSGERTERTRADHPQQSI